MPSLMGGESGEVSGLLLVKEGLGRTMTELFQPVHQKRGVMSRPGWPNILLHPPRRSPPLLPSCLHSPGSSPCSSHATTQLQQTSDHSHPESGNITRDCGEALKQKIVKFTAFIQGPESPSAWRSISWLKTFNVETVTLVKDNHSHCLPQPSPPSAKI